MTSALTTFEYEILADNDRPWWQFWIPKDVVFGTITARDEAKARDALAPIGVTNVVTDFRKLSPVTSVVRRALFHRRVPPELTLEFIGNYATMTESGDVSPKEACQTLSAMAKHPYMRFVIATIGSLVSGSVKLWEACELFPDVFDRYTVAVVRSGEDKGGAILHPVLLDLENELRAKNDVRILRRQMLRDVNTIGVSVLVLVLVFFLGFVPVIENNHPPGGVVVAPPWWLAPLVIASYLLQNVFFDVAFLLLLLATYIGFRAYVSTPAGRYWRDAIAVKRLGQYSALLRLQCQAEVLRAFARLYDINLDPWDAWTEAAPVANNLVYEDAFIEVRDRVKNGVALPQALTDAKFGKIDLVDPRAVTMIRAAEPSGPDVLARRMVRLSNDMRAEAKRGMEWMVSQNHVRAQYIFGAVILIISFFTLALFGNALENI